jgi:hypothetical protein
MGYAKGKNPPSSKRRGALPKPWAVGVISTDYDLRSYRNAVIRELKRSRFSVYAFEEPNFPVDAGIHSHEACRVAMQYADIVVLMLDKRYGGKYLGKRRRSVTQVEYERARELAETRPGAFGRVLVPCVSKPLWDDRHRLLGDAKKKLGPDATRREVTAALRGLTPMYDLQEQGSGADGTSSRA